jgi:hypothetical protein
VAIAIRGVGFKAATVPLGLEAARTYFADVPTFLRKIDMVETVRELGRPDAFLVIHKTVGAMNFQATSAYAIQVEHTAHGMTFLPLDFEVAQLKSPHPVVKGFVEGSLKLTPQGENMCATELTFIHTADIDQAGPLAFIPAGMIKTTADGLMTMIIGSTIESMWRKVKADFPATTD